MGRSSRAWPPLIWQTLLRDSRDGILAFDDECRYTVWNATMERISGMPADRVLGKVAFELFPFLKETGEDVLFYEALTGREAKSKDQPYRIPETGRVGTFEGHYFPLRDESGIVSGGMAIIRDVTDRRTAEENLQYVLNNANCLLWHATVREARDRPRTYVWKTEVFQKEAAQRFLPLYLQPGEEYMEALDRSKLPGEAQRMNDFSEEALNTGVRHYSQDFACRQSDGEVRWLHEEVSIDPLEPGFWRIAGVFNDITDRVEAEQRQKAQAEVTRILVECRTLAEAAPRILQTIGETTRWDFGALWMVTSSDDLRCRFTWRAPGFVCPAFEAETQERKFARGVGLPGTIWEQSVPLWLPHLEDEVHFPRMSVAHREGLRCGVGFPLLIGGEVTGVLEFFGTICREPDDDLLEAMHGIGIHIGRFIERERAEDALRLSETRFQSLMDNTPAVAFIKDEAGHHLYVNHRFEEAFNLRAHEWKGKTVFDLWPEKTARQLRESDLATLSSGRLVETLETIHRPEGDQFWLTFKFPLPDISGQRLVAGMAIDVTDRHRLEEELEYRLAELAEADLRKDEYLATLAHELRNPLAPIITAVELMRLQGPTDVRLEKARATIERQVRRMARLIDDLLDVARITRGLVELQVDTLDLRTAVEHAVGAARPALDARSHRVALSLPDQPIYVHADPTRIEQVITNLLQNAAKFTPAGGVVLIRCEAAGAEAIVEVTDTGKGIPREMLSSIFELFSQANPPIDRAEGGLGLGLTLVRRLVQMHGGTVEAASEGPGQGSTFTVRLPLTSAAEIEAPATTAVAQHRSVRSLKVLVVDDNADAAQTLQDLLLIWGHEVRTAGDGPTALAIAAEFEPDVALLDIGLPGMDGYQVARWLQDSSPPSKVVLIAITGFGQEDDRKRSEAAGFAHHLVKPVDPQELRGLLEEVG